MKPKGLYCSELSLPCRVSTQLLGDSLILRFLMVSSPGSATLNGRACFLADCGSPRYSDLGISKNPAELLEEHPSFKTSTLPMEPPLVYINIHNLLRLCTFKDSWLPQDRIMVSKVIRYPHLELHEPIFIFNFK